MTSQHHFEHEININGYDVEVTIEFDYTPATDPCLEVPFGEVERIEITDIRAKEEGDMLGLVTLLGEDVIIGWIESWREEWSEV